MSGETVALMMGNRPEYFAIWLGLTQVGAIVALISPDLRAPAVAHALKVARARRVIAAAECADACAEARVALDESIEIWIHGQGRPDLQRIDLAVSTRTARRSQRMSDDLSRSPIARCEFSPRERQVCQRPLKSVIVSSSSGAIGLLASRA